MLNNALFMQLPNADHVFYLAIVNEYQRLVLKAHNFISVFFVTRAMLFQNDIYCSSVLT
jgi:hypothetical protein